MKGPVSTVEGAVGIRDLASARLWDLGDAVAGLEIAAEYGICDAGLIESLGTARDVVARDFRALVVFGGDSRLFSAGASLDPFVAAIASADWSVADGFLAQGQAVLQGLKYAPFPVLAAIHVAALSGGCELALHADARIVEAGAVFGFRERWSGIVPGWGGATQVLLRLQPAVAADRAVARVFEAFARARLHRADDAARHAGFLGPGDTVVAHRDELLPTAHRLAVELAHDYRPPPPGQVTLATPGIGESAMAVVDEVDADERFIELERTACLAMLDLLTADGRVRVSEAEQMRRERDLFVELLRAAPGVDQRMQAIAASGGRRPASGNRS